MVNVCKIKSATEYINIRLQSRLVFTKTGHTFLPIYPLMGIHHLVAWLKGICTRAKDWRFLKLLRHQVIITLGAFFVFSKPLLTERFSLNDALLLCNYVRALCTAHLSLLLKTSDAFSASSNFATLKRCSLVGLTLPP